MPVTIACPSCTKKFRAPDSLSGKKTKCPGCATVFQVPAFAAAAPAQAASKPAALVVPPEPESAYENRDEYQLDFGEDDLGGGFEGDGIGSLADLAPPPAAASNLAPAPQAPANFGQLAMAPQQAAAGNKAKREKKKKERNFDGSYGTVFGMDLTIGLMVKFAMVFGVLGFLAYLWFRDPIQILDVQAVDASVPVSGITRMKGATVLNPMGGGTPGEYCVGGTDKLYVTRPNGNGSHVIVRLQASQAYWNDNGFTSGYGISFTSGDFTIERGGQTLQGTILTNQLDNDHRLSLAEAKSSSWKAMVPEGVEPAEKKMVESKRGTQGTGTFIFDGSNGATGEFDWVSYQMAYGGMASGMSGQGYLQYQSPQGVDTNLNYAGGDMTIDTDAGDSAWHGSAKFAREDEVSPYTKVVLTLLFPMPPGTGEMSINVRGKQVATVSGSHANQSTTTFVKDSSYSRPNRETEGGNRLAKNYKKKPGGGYFDAVLGARKKVTGGVSMSNMKQLLVIMTSFRDTTKRWPDTLQELAGQFPEAIQVMRNPLTREQYGYVYIKPTKDTDLFREPILFEKLNGKPDPQGLQGYADGRVE